jgi:hypothetical protein
MPRFRYSSTQTASSSSRSPKVFSENRVCGFPNCTTRLSRYNADSLCALHAKAQRPPQRTTR